MRDVFVKLRVPSGKRAEWRAAACELGVTLTALVERAVDEAVAAESAVAGDAARRAEERSRLRGRVFPAKP